MWLTGGVERVITNLTDGLSKFFEVHILIHSDLVECDYPLSPNVKFLYLKNTSNSIDDIFIYINEHNIDLVIANSGILLKDLDICKSLLSKKIKLIVCNHESYFYPHTRKMFYQSIVKRIDVLNEANAVTFPTPYSVRAYNCFNANGVLMPNLLSEDVNASYRKEYKKNRHILLVVGRWDDPNKHLDKVLEIFARVKKLKEDCEIYVVGKVIFDRKLNEKSSETINEVLTRLSLRKDDIHFIGLSYDVKQFYMKADVFLLTSETEAFAMVLPEAGSNGLPSVIFSIPGLDGYIVKNGENGFICRQDDFDGAAEKIYNLLVDDNLYHQMSNNAIKLAGRFSKSILVDKWKNLITAVIDEDNEKLKCAIDQTDNHITMKDFCSASNEYQNVIRELLYAEQHNINFMVEKNIFMKVWSYYEENGLILTLMKIKNKLLKRWDL